MVTVRDRHGRSLSHKDVAHKAAFRIYKIIVELEVFILHIAGLIPIHTIRNAIYILGGIKIGFGSTIHTGARFYHPSNIKIGKDTIIGEGVILDGRDRLIIGDHVDMASEVMIYNAYHDLKSEYFDPIMKPVVIEDYVFIGPRVIILPGITIGKGAVVAAGAVVTKSVPALTIVAGVPAEKIGTRSEKSLGYKLGRADWFR